MDCIKQTEIFPQCKVSGRSETKSQKILKFPQAKILTFFNFGLFRSLLRRQGTVEKFPKKSVGTLFFWERQSHDYHTLLRVLIVLQVKKKFTSKRKKVLGTFFWRWQSHDYNTLLKGVNRVVGNLLYINMVSTGIIKARYVCQLTRRWNPASNWERYYSWTAPSLLSGCCAALAFFNSFSCCSRTRIFPKLDCWAFGRSAKSKPLTWWGNKFPSL